MMEEKLTRLGQVASPTRPDSEAAEERRRRREEHRKGVQALHDRLMDEQGKMSEKEAGMVAGRFSELLDSLKGQVRRKDLAHRAWPQLSETSAASKLRGYLLPARLKGAKRTERLRHLVRRARLYVPLTDALAELTSKEEPGYYLPQLVAGTRYEDVEAGDFDSDPSSRIAAKDYEQEQFERHEPFVELLRRMAERLCAKYDLPRYFRELSRRNYEPSYYEDGSMDIAPDGPEQEINPKGLISHGQLSEFLRPGGEFRWGDELLPSVPLYRARTGDPLPIQVQISPKRYDSVSEARNAPCPRQNVNERAAKFYRYIEVRLAIAPRDDEGRCQPVFLVYPRDAAIELIESQASRTQYWTCGWRSWNSFSSGDVLTDGEKFYRSVLHAPCVHEGTGDPGVARSDGPESGDDTESGLWPTMEFHPVNGMSCQRFLVDIPSRCCPSDPAWETELLFEAHENLWTSLDGSALAFPWSTVGMALEDSLVGPRPEGPRVSELLEEAIRERVTIIENRITEEREYLVKIYDAALARLFREPEPKESQEDETHN